MLSQKNCVSEEKPFLVSPSSERADENRRSVRRPNRAWRVLLGAAIVFLLCWGVLSLWTSISELGPSAVLSGLNPFAAHEPENVIHLREQPVYKVKKKQKLLGTEVVRIISRQQPQEFLVLSSVSSHLLDTIFGKPIDRFWANQMASQLARLRSTSGSADEPGSSTHDPTIDVQSVESEQVVPLLVPESLGGERKQSRPYWQLRLRFQLSTETLPRYYQVGILRSQAHFKAATSSQKESILIAYAPQNTYQKSLILDLLKYLQISGGKE
jgi:hypothetical protein